ncbi:unnamed protein product [Macrosiphum euphorbiae]|uniref:Transposable element P transposase-like RNase H domain-containing protein n=1 Tax=Macrosiphum euphorbiae TaxID=13131 RepID=A0AAV0VEU9_9HEMI|nr:unnamed protein product [Macrosiphum euphorbiae]
MFGQYGFQQAIFDLLAKKADCMAPKENLGILLLDEIKLSESVSFNKKTLKALAVFLSKGCASSTVLHKIVIECVILLEKSGFHIDNIATDGATWNRSIWTKFVISSENISCEHIYDSSRRLWFLSDFGFNLKICPGLSYDDIHPKPYQKINVGRAYRFFGEKTAITMEIYRENNIDLIDCEPSVILISRINSLIQAMDFRIPSNSLRKASPEYKVIKDFIDYLDQWHDNAEKKTTVIF